jgi:hypothetical protein
MPELGPSGSVRGAPSNGRPYRDSATSLNFHFGRIMRFSALPWTAGLRSEAVLVGTGGRANTGRVGSFARVLLRPRSCVKLNPRLWPGWINGRVGAAVDTWDEQPRMIASSLRSNTANYGMSELKAKFRSPDTPEGPYELSEAAGGAANLNREMIRLLDFAEQLEQAGDSILGLQRGREMRLIVHLIRNYLSGQLTTSSSLAVASGLSHGTAMRTIERMKRRGLIVQHSRTETGKSVSLHPAAKLLDKWQGLAEAPTPERVV